MKALAGERHQVDFANLRRDFPIFERKVHGKPLIYLDSTATTQKPRAVLEALDRYYRTYNANIHRGVYRIAEEATEAYEAVRSQVARLLHARSAREIVFTRGATEAVNLVSNSWGRSTSCMQALSTISSEYCTRRCFAATLRAQARNNPSDSFMMFALWMATTLRRFSRLTRSNVNSAMRREARAVITLTLSTTPGATSCSIPA